MLQDPPQFPNGGPEISVKHTFLDFVDDNDDPLAPPTLARASTVPSPSADYEDFFADEDLQTDSGGKGTDAGGGLSGDSPVPEAIPLARCISCADTPVEPFRYAADEDEATQDFPDVLAPKSSTKILRLETHLDMRCSSPASTTATALSPVSMRFPLSPASSPDRDFVSPTEPEDDIDAPSPDSEDQKHQCPPGALDKRSYLNARKVFVGGIPQIVDRNALYHMFSKFGKVEKVLLMFHNDQGVCRESPAQHRGFAFVIFCEMQSVDALLGTDFSRIVRFDNDMLEVKRSVSKALSEKKETAGKAKRSTMESPVPYPTIPRNTEASSHTFPSASPVGLQMPSCPSPCQYQGPSCAMALQAFLIPVQFVPAFPVQATSPVQWPPLGGITVSSYPPVAPAPQQIRQQPNSSVAQAGQQNPLHQQPDISELVTERWGEKREI